MAVLTPMADDDHSAAGDTGHTLAGSSETTVQARDIGGDVHLHTPRQRSLPVPRQLPTPVAHFVNRVEELAHLDGYLSAETAGPGSVVISAIGGTAGAGKTALAVHWAHRVRDRFPDGDLYVNLRGYDAGTAVPPGQALERFLQALDVPPQSIPSDMEAQAALYRSILTNRRMLVILDNAATPQQIRPLLPPAPGCMALVTSRSRLSGLAVREGAHTMALDLLNEAESLALLREIIDDQRVEAEPDAAGALARRCCYLPLALRIVAQRALSNPDLELSEIVDELAAEHERLDVLSTIDDDDASIRAVFSWSYQALTDETARMFRLLGLHPGSDISLPAAAAIADLTPNKTRRLLETLVNAHLLQQHSHGRYRLHDLLRAYAAERAEHEERAEQRHDALGRLLEWYLGSIDAAIEKHYGSHRLSTNIHAYHADVSLQSFNTTEDALSWLDSEVSNISALTVHASSTGHINFSWKLPVTCFIYYNLRKLWSTWMELYPVAIAAADRQGDSYGKACLLNGNGIVQRDLGNLEGAAESYSDSLVHWTQSEDRWGHALALSNLSDVNEELGKLNQALQLAEQARGEWININDKWGESLIEFTMGSIHRKAGRPTEALNSYEKSLRETMRNKDWWGSALSVSKMASIHQEAGSITIAIEYLRESLELYRKSDRRWDIAATAEHLGRLLADEEKFAEARHAWNEALPIFDSQDPDRASHLRQRLDSLPGTDG